MEIKMKKQPSGLRMVLPTCTHVVCVSIDMPLPKCIMLELRKAIEVMFSKMATYKKINQEECILLPLKNSDFATIVTRFVFDQDADGYIVKAVIYLKKLAHVIKRKTYEILNAAVNATLVAKPGIGVGIGFGIKKLSTS